MEEQAVTVRDMERNGQTLDVTVAARPLQTGVLPTWALQACSQGPHGCDSQAYSFLKCSVRTAISSAFANYF